MARYCMNPLSCNVYYANTHAMVCVYLGLPSTEFFLFRALISYLDRNENLLLEIIAIVDIVDIVCGVRVRNI
jgi:hypothetical protein